MTMTENMIITHMSATLSSLVEENLDRYAAFGGNSDTLPQIQGFNTAVSQLEGHILVDSDQSYDCLFNCTQTYKHVISMCNVILAYLNVVNVLLHV